MRHAVYRLETEDAGRLALRATGRRSWLQTVVVPRAVCVFEQVPCGGVAWHERRGFAKLQVLRLGPYANTGACAAVRNKRLMLWLWDADEVNAAIAAAGMDPGSCALLAEPLVLPVPVRSGTFELSCQGGTDRLELDGGAIRSARWEPLRTGRKLAAPDLLTRPWATNLCGQHGLAGSTLGLSPRELVGASVGLAVIAAAAHLAYWAGTYYSLQSQAEAVAQVPDQDSAKLATVSRFKQSERNDAAWLSHYERLSASLRVEALLDALEKPMEAHRLVIKELEVRNDDLRLTVAAVGGDIDLPAVLMALERVPGFDTVQLRQNNDTVQATYSMRVAGYRQSGLPMKGPL